MWGGLWCLCSPPILPTSGLQQTVCCIDAELTHMPRHCRPQVQTECAALRRPLEIFSKMMAEFGTNTVPAGKKNKVPSEVRKHTVSLSCSVVKLVYSISLTSQTQAATVDPQCRRRKNKVNNTEQERNSILLYGAELCRSDVFKSLCVCLPVCVCSCQCHKAKNETAYEKKRKPGSSSCAC